MQVGVRALRHVVVEDNVHSLNVHASTKQICGHQDALLKVLEGLVAGQPEKCKHRTAVVTQDQTNSPNCMNS